MTPCFFLQSNECSEIEQILAALKTIGLSVQTYSFSANVTGGSRGPPRAGIVGSQLAGFGTATCDAGVPGISMVFGLPFDTDTWNSFIQHSLAAKRLVMGFSLFRNFRVTIQIVNSCVESFLLSHSLTLAPRCPVGRFPLAARVNSLPRVMAGTNRAAAAERSFAC